MFNSAIRFQRQKTAMIEEQGKFFRTHVTLGTARSEPVKLWRSPLGGVGLHGAFGTRPALRLRSIPTAIVEDRLLGVRAQDTVVRRIADRNLDGRLVGCGAVLNPVAQLLKEASRGATHTAEAVAQAGSLEVAVEVLDIRDDLVHCLVVVFGATGRDDVVSLQTEG